MSAMLKEIQRSRLPPMVKPPGSQGTSSSRRAFASRRDYTPLNWDAYFDTSSDVEVSEGNVFRVYRTGDAGPVLLLLHGGGYSGLTWALMAATIIKLVDCQVLAIDLRGHGNTRTTNDGDLSAETMANDVGAVIELLFSDDCPPIILVGHSMGGAIAVHAAYRRLIPALIGLIVIDVVEGTAIDALASMQSFLRARPSAFRSIENAVEWCVRSGQVRNLESARVSMPGQIKNTTTGSLATVDVAERAKSESGSREVDDGPSFHRDNIIPEESEANEEHAKSEETKPDVGHFKMPLKPADNMKYSWRIDLSKTEKYWTGWFQGLSNMFLDCPVAKLLLLAGVDRLDKDLTIGQMQGKFQMQVLPQCGHAVHEDVPDKVAEVIASFLVRNKFVLPSDNFQM